MSNSVGMKQLGDNVGNKCTSVCFCVVFYTG